MALFKGGEYMYSVFVKIILTNQGKKILCKHQGDKYAQRVYAKLPENVLKYIMALLNSSKLDVFQPKTGCSLSLSGTSEEPVGNTRTVRHHKSKTYRTKWK